jgi:hypothetical protein
MSVAMLAACASIPTSGPVRAGRELGVDAEANAPRTFGGPPDNGASPEEIVQGFLQASPDFVDDHSIARQYLAPRVRQRWNPAAETAIYDRSLGYSVESDGGTTWQVSATQVARIDESGRYRRLGPPAALERSFTVGQIAGQWRITDVPDGLLMSSANVEFVYRQLNLYFLAPTTNVVVPDPVLLPNQPGLPTTLLNRLLQGPTPDLQGAVETAFPRATQLEVRSVPVRDGLATVSFNAAALQADSGDRDRMSAQIVWTLKQLREVQRVRILADGDDLVTSGVAREQPVSEAWVGYDPDILAPTASFYIVRDGRVGRIINERFVPVLGLAGAPGAGLRLPAVSLDTTRVAAVSADRTRLLVGRLAAGAVLDSVLTGTDLTAPSYDRGNDLWVVERGTGRLWLLPADAETPVEVKVPRVGGAGPIAAVRVAREGTRMALVMGSGNDSRIYVGAIVRDSTGAVDRVDALHEVLPDMRAVRDIAWTDASTVAVLGRDGDAPEAVVQTSTDGLSVNDNVEPLAGLSSVAAAPPPLTLVASTLAGQVQQWTPSLGWQPLGPGRDPSYPG